jgi:uncharacterized RmlC-like cupin family protein
MTASTTDAVRVIRPGQTYVGKQGFAYGAGVSAETAGARGICMNVLPMPAGIRAKVHCHEGIETISYMLEGECEVYYGDTVERSVLVRQGDHVYLPADVPHAPWNRSGAPCTCLVAHSSGSDQDGLVLLPELDALLEATATVGKES